MIHSDIIFGTKRNHSPADLEDIIETYLGELFHTGQLCGEYSFTWINKILTGHVMLSSPTAYLLKYHSQYGKKHLKTIIAKFGKEPRWNLRDDDVVKKTPTWRKAPLLYLFTEALDHWPPPVHRGDNGCPIPSYSFPIKYEDKEDLYFWQRSYYHHDNIWLGSGALEISAYRQLADPNSDLSLYGRSIAQQIEKNTGIPTYYYLKRYWGRKTDEDKRKCPGCGHDWRTTHPIDDIDVFWQFSFQCKKCRLISHIADSYDNERLAAIGEFQKKRR